MINNIEIAKKWYEKSKDEKNDNFDRFIYLWIAFNALYNQEYDKEERMRIKKYIKNDIKKSGTIFNDILTMREMHIFLDKQVKSVYNKDEYDYSSKRYQKLKDANNEISLRAEALFCTLYQVRCNLFHGDKSPDEQRDADLVKNAGIILNKYLDACLN